MKVASADMTDGLSLDPIFLGHKEQTDKVGVGEGSGWGCGGAVILDYGEEFHAVEYEVVGVGGGLSPLFNILQGG